MSNRIRPQRKALASLMLGAWLFGLFVGIAHACGVGHATMTRPNAVFAAAVDDLCAGDIPAGCEKFCNDDVPVVAKIQSAADPSAAHPIVLASLHRHTFASIPAPDFHPAMAAHLAPGVPLSLRVVRLAL